jgi:branched-chain amino acid transport system permease protein
LVDITLLFSDIVYGLLLGCVFSVMALGLNLIWGVIKIVNIAHGEFIMLGAYSAYFLNLLFNINPLISALLNTIFGFGLGLIFYFALIHKELKDKETITLQDEMVTLVATFGLSLFLSTLALLLFSGNSVGINWSIGSIYVGFLNIPLGALYVAVTSLVIIYFVHNFLTKTYLGNAIRAYSQDIIATQLIGANPTKIAAIATSIGIALTMLSGSLLTVWIPVGINPYMGSLYAPISFVIIVMGGKGKMWGSLIGGLIMGVIIDTAQIFIPPSLAYAIAFLILIPILLISKEGILK